MHCILRIFFLFLVVGEARSDAELGGLAVVHGIVAVDRAQALDPTLHLGWKVFIGRPGTCEQCVAERDAVAPRHFQGVKERGAGRLLQITEIGMPIPAGVL